MDIFARHLIAAKISAKAIYLIVPEEARERVKQRARQEFEREIRERVETEIKKRVQCQTDADCRGLVCPVVVGADTPRCDLETSTYYCGARVNDLIPALPIDIPGRPAGPPAGRP